MLISLPVFLEVSAVEPFFTTTSSLIVRRFVRRIIDDVPLLILDVA